MRDTPWPPPGPAPVLELLHQRQEDRGHLTEADLHEAAALAGLSPAELYGVIAAYPGFRLDPETDQEQICVGPACTLAGAAGHTRGRRPVPCLGRCEAPIAVLTSEGPRRAADPKAILAAGPDPVERADPSVFFGEDDPLEAVASARRRPPEELLQSLEEAGLRGRGGAGFPTARKWAAVRAAAVGGKVLVCNADESEPGTFKDRQLLERQPRRVLAGMLVAAHVTGADTGIVYLRREYEPERRRLLAEIEALRDEGALGSAFDVVVRRGAGAYVCGEETALLNSLEGRKPTPRDRPPFPTTAGLFGAPTLVQNVETLAAVPAIVVRGASWFREARTPKLYCVSGDVPRPGVYELPMDVTAAQLLERAGARPGELAAFTLGGLSGGLLPPGAAAVCLDYDDPRRLGAHLGSGATIAVGRRRCVLRFARDAIAFFAEESCGKCFPCRLGTRRLHDRLSASLEGEPAARDETRDLVSVLETGSACGLGTAAGRVAGHLLVHFADEVAAHQRGGCRGA